MKDENVPEDEGTSSTLLLSAQNGDHEAWGRIAAVYEPVLERWLRQFGLGDADTPDIRQEVFVAAFQNLKDFRRQQTGSFRKWLKTIARNKVNDGWRKQRLPLAGPVPEDIADSSESAAELSEQKRLLFQKIVDFCRTEFEDATWQMFKMTAMDGIPADEVAGQLGKTRGAVYIARTRVIAKVRECFKDVIEEGWLQ